MFNIYYTSTPLKNYYHPGYFQNSRIQIIYKYNLNITPCYLFLQLCIQNCKNHKMLPKIFFICRYLTHHFFIYLFINTSILVLNKIGILCRTCTFQKNNVKISKSLPIVQTMSNGTTRLCISADVYQSYGIAYLSNNVK